MRAKFNMGVFYVISAGVLWGIVALFTNQLSAYGASSVQITETRCITATIILFILLIFKDKNLFKIHLKDIWMFIGTGLLSIGLFNICYFQCIKISTLSIACILLYTGPCFVVLISALLFHEKISKQKLICLFLAFVGCIFVSGVFDSGASNITLFGFLIGLCSGFCYGLYSIFGHYALKKYNPYTITFYTFAVAAVGLLPFSRPMSLLQIYINSKPLNNPFGPITSIGAFCVLIAVLLGVLSTTLPFLFYTKGLSLMEAGKASLFAFLEPLTATLISILVFGENITLFSGIGILLIMICVFCLNLPSKITRKTN